MTAWSGMTGWDRKLRQHKSTLKYIISAKRHWSYTFHQKKPSVWSLVPTNKTIWNVLSILGVFLSSFTECIAYAKRKQQRLNKYTYILSAESYNNPFTLMRLILFSRSQSFGHSQLLHSPSFFVHCYQDIKSARKMSNFLFTETPRPLGVSSEKLCTCDQDSLSINLLWWKSMSISKAMSHQTFPPPKYLYKNGAAEYAV